MFIDISQNNQSYIESRRFGSEVCCNPIQLKIKVENNAILQFDVLNIGQ